MITSILTTEEVEKHFHDATLYVDELKMGVAPTEDTKTGFNLQVHLWGVPPAADKLPEAHPARDLSLRWHSTGRDLLSAMTPFIGIASEDEEQASETRMRILVHYAPGLAASLFRETCDINTVRDIPPEIGYPQLIPEQRTTVGKDPAENSYSKRVQNEISMAEDLTRPDEQKRLLRRLYEFEQQNEADRWPTTDWPTPQAFADAGAFIRSWTIPSMPAPHLTLADDGEINFYWGQNGIHIDLGFYGTGKYSYYAHGKEGERFSDDNVPASSGLPADLLGLLGT